MTNDTERYDLYTAAAWIRGHAKAAGIPSLTEEQLDLPLEDLGEEELKKIVAAGEQAELKLYQFKSGKKEPAPNDIFKPLALLIHSFFRLLIYK